MRKILVILLVVTVISIKLKQNHEHHKNTLQHSHLSQKTTHFIDWGHFNTDNIPNPKDLLTNWQSGLNDNLPISKVSLPGTHQSGAIDGTCISGRAICTNFKETQTWPIFDQLTAGIRFLQINVCAGDSAQKIRICLKDAQYQLLSDLLKIVDDFLKKFPSQFLIIYLTQSNNTKDLSDQVFTIISKSMISQKVFLSRNIPLVKEIRGKAWFWGGKGLTFNGKTFDVSYPALNSFILQNDKKIEGKSQLVLKTAFQQPCEDFKMKINRLDLSSNDTQTYKFAKARGQPNDRLDSQLRKQPKICIGITIMDYPGSNLIHGIIKTNLPKK